MNVYNILFTMVMDAKIMLVFKTKKTAYAVYAGI